MQRDNSQIVPTMFYLLVDIHGQHYTNSWQIRGRTKERNGLKELRVREETLPLAISLG